MKPYAFFTFDGSERTPELALSEFKTLGDAVAHAFGLLKDDPDYAAVEVWDGKSEPVRVSRA